MDNSSTTSIAFRIFILASNFLGGITFIDEPLLNHPFFTKTILSFCVDANMAHSKNNVPD